LEKIWAATLSAGIPAEVDYGEYRSTGELFESVSERLPRPSGLYNMGKTISFDELEHMTRAVGAWLQSKGLAKGPASR